MDSRKWASHFSGCDGVRVDDRCNHMLNFPTKVSGVQEKQEVDVNRKDFRLLLHGKRQAFPFIPNVLGESTTSPACNPSSLLRVKHSPGMQSFVLPPFLSTPTTLPPVQVPLSLSPLMGKLQILCFLVKGIRVWHARTLSRTGNASYRALFSTHISMFLALLHSNPQMLYVQ
jgi:hypothetical protein